MSDKSRLLIVALCFFLVLLSVSGTTLVTNSRNLKSASRQRKTSQNQRSGLRVGNLYHVDSSQNLKELFPRVFGWKSSNKEDNFLSSLFSSNNESISSSSGTFLPHLLWVPTSLSSPDRTLAPNPPIQAGCMTYLHGAGEIGNDLDMLIHSRGGQLAVPNLLHRIATTRASGRFRAAYAAADLHADVDEQMRTLLYGERVGGGGNGSNSVVAHKTHHHLHRKSFWFEKFVVVMPQTPVGWGNDSVDRANELARLYISATDKTHERVFNRAMRQPTGKEENGGGGGGGGARATKRRFATVVTGVSQGGMGALRAALRAATKAGASSRFFYNVVSPVCGFTEGDASETTVCTAIYPPSALTTLGSSAVAAADRLPLSRLYIIHGDNDNMVPSTHSHSLFEACSHAFNTSWNNWLKALLSKREGGSDDDGEPNKSVPQKKNAMVVKLRYKDAAELKQQRHEVLHSLAMAQLGFVSLSITPDPDDVIAAADSHSSIAKVNNKIMRTVGVSDPDFMPSGHGHAAWKDAYNVDSPFWDFVDNSFYN